MRNKRRECGVGRQCQRWWESKKTTTNHPPHTLCARPGLRRTYQSRAFTRGFAGALAFTRGFTGALPASASGTSSHPALAIATASASDTTTTLPRGLTKRGINQSTLSSMIAKRSANTYQPYTISRRSATWFLRFRSPWPSGSPCWISSTGSSR